jgi:xylan 1,4-beta-xylosidase
MMPTNRVEVKNGLAYDYARIRDESVRVEADINALASKDANSAAVMVWNYHDDNLPGPDASVSVRLNGLPNKTITLHHYRIDQKFSNSYEAWKKMGSPKTPSAEQVAQLEKAGQLQQISAPERVSVKNGEAVLNLTLPRQGVSLLQLTWD